jgi:hypothetical protein
VMSITQHDLRPIKSQRDWSGIGTRMLAISKSLESDPLCLPKVKLKSAGIIFNKGRDGCKVGRQRDIYIIFYDYCTMNCGLSFVNMITG